MKTKKSVKKRERKLGISNKTLIIVLCIGSRRHLSKKGSQYIVPHTLSVLVIILET